MMNRKTRKMMVFACFALLLCATACTHRLTAGKVKTLFKHSPIVNDHFTGFALYDLDNGKMIYQLNDDKYFTPASNTKLFTFYTCLKLLGDSIPGLKYVVRNDSLIFWGTGDPTFLHSVLKGTNAFNLLRNADRRLFFSPGLYQNALYGEGWAWDDYNDYYQAEISELPMEDNVAIVYADSSGTMQITPSTLKPYLKCDSNYKPSSFRVQRDFLTNSFVYPAMKPPAGYRKEIPWKTGTALTLNLLEDTMKRPVEEIHLPLDTNAKTIYNARSDSVYKFMLQESDNFFAEQLLLVCSSVKFGVLNTDSVIQYSKTHFLNDLPDAPQWVDGSGLSRQNLFTPRSIIALLIKIRDQVKDDDKLHQMLPIGGVAGTLKNAYKTDNGQPFV